MPSIRVVNQTAHFNRKLVTLGCLFEESDNLTSNAADELIVVNGNRSATTSGVRQDNVPVQWYPQGVRYPSGSIKYARCSFIGDFEANEDVVLNLRRGTATNAPLFNMPLLVFNGIQSARFTLNINGIIDNISLDINSPGVQLIESGLVYQRYRIFNYHTVNPNIWYEIVFDLQNNSPTIRFWFSFGYCRARTDTGRNGPNRIFDLQRAILTIRAGVFSKIYHSQYKCMNTSTVPNTNFIRYDLVQPAGGLGNRNNFRWGSAFAYSGIILMDANDPSYNSETHQTDRVLACARNWANNMAPVFQTPERPSYLPSAAAGDNIANSIVAQSFRSINSERLPYAWISWGADPATGSTGNQGIYGYAFGPMRGWPWFLTGNPSFIPAAEMHTQVQFSREHIYVNSIGGVMSAQEFQNAGGLMWWGTYFFQSPCYTGASGIIDDEVRPRASVRFLPMSGPDREHWMCVWESIFAFTTMDYHAVRFMNEFHAQHWEAANRSDTGNISIDVYDASRAIGRCLHAGACLAEFTNQNTTRAALERRCRDLVNQYRQRLPRPRPNYGRVQSLDTNDLHFMQEFPPPGTPTEGKVGQLPWNFHWRPWEESIALMGIQAAINVLTRSNPTYYNNELADLREIRDMIAASIVLHGLFDLTTDWQLIGLRPNSYGGNAGNFNTTLWPKGITITAPNGARGELYHVETWRTQDGGHAEFLLRNCQGQFPTAVNDYTITASNGSTATAYFRRSWVSGVALEPGEFSIPGPNTLGRAPTFEQLLANPRTETHMPQFGYHNPYGFIPHVLWYETYNEWMLPAAVIAYEVASNNGYQNNNATIEDKARRFLNFMRQIESEGNLGNWEERFATYTNIGFGSGGNVGTSGNKIIRAAVTVGRFVVPEADGSAVSNSTSITVNAGSIPNSRLVSPRATISTTSVVSTNVSVNVSIGGFTLRSQRLTHRIRAGTGTKVVNVSTCNFTADVPTNIVYSVVDTKETQASRFLLMRMKNNRNYISTVSATMAIYTNTTGIQFSYLPLPDPNVVLTDIPEVLSSETTPAESE